MSDARAITADFASLKWINGRKVLQIICEVPTERTEEVLAKLGNPSGEGIPVAIAVLDIQPDVKKDLAENAEKAKRRFEELPYSQQAALLCKDGCFRHYNYRHNKDGTIYTPNESEIVQILYTKLGIKSRSELDDVNNANARNAFENLRDAYRAETGSYPEQRG